MKNDITQETLLEALGAAAKRAACQRLPVWISLLVWGYALAVAVWALLRMGGASW